MWLWQRLQMDHLLSLQVTSHQSLMVVTRPFHNGSSYTWLGSELVWAMWITHDTENHWKPQNLIGIHIMRKVANELSYVQIHWCWDSGLYIIVWLWLALCSPLRF
jgi:hypothetical protein